MSTYQVACIAHTYFLFFFAKDKQSCFQGEVLLRICRPNHCSKKWDGKDNEERWCGCTCLSFSCYVNISLPIDFGKYDITLQLIFRCLRFHCKSSVILDVEIMEKHLGLLAVSTIGYFKEKEKVSVDWWTIIEKTLKITFYLLLKGLLGETC